MITVGQMTDWIIEHRCGDAFKDWTREQVESAVAYSVNDHTLLYSHDGDKLSGVMVMAFLGEKELFIAGALVKKEGLLLNFSEAINTKFRGYKVSATRKGRHVTYNLNRLTQLLRKMK
jgi:hypothetical protein